VIKHLGERGPAVPVQHGTEICCKPAEEYHFLPLFSAVQQMKIWWLIFYFLLFFANLLWNFSEIEFGWKVLGVCMLSQWN